MLFDWFTFGVQALNFLVLVVLLKRFLYKPILNAIDEREKRIAAEVADANLKQTAAAEEQAAFRRRNEDFDREREALFRDATTQANTEHERLLEAARAAVQSVTLKRAEAMRADARTLSEALTRRTQQIVFQIARKALDDLATTSLEERLADVFIRRLRALSGEPKQQLAQALKSSSEPAVLRSAFGLPVGQQAAIQAALNETFSAEVLVRFEVAAHVISGIELSCGGQKIGWSIQEYLTSLEDGVGELLDARAKPAAQAPAHTAARGNA